jgi:inhibitor of cysteine peptidase
VSRPSAIELHESGPGGPQTVRVGQEVVIRLTENPTSGYAWEVRQSGSGTVRVIEDRYEPGGQGRVGAGGQRIVRLLGEQAGQVQLELVHRRPWEPDSAARERRRYVMHIQ